MVAGSDSQSRRRIFLLLDVRHDWLLLLRQVVNTEDIVCGEPFSCLGDVTRCFEKMVRLWLVASGAACVRHRRMHPPLASRNRKSPSWPSRHDFVSSSSVYSRFKTWSMCVGSSFDQQQDTFVLRNTVGLASCSQR